ncbi:MAG: hypothetical protein WBZ23_07390, partial [Pseudolabrys sp.]
VVERQQALPLGSVARQEVLPAWRYLAVAADAAMELFVQWPKTIPRTARRRLPTPKECSSGFGQSLSLNPVRSVPGDPNQSGAAGIWPIRPKSLIDDTQKIHVPAQYLATQAKTRQTGNLVG